MSYEISTEKFDGPLDLLLHLISVHQIDIYDVPIATITAQYMAYIYQWQEMNMEVAAEFIVMGARLLEIKSYLLLPRSSEEQIEGEDLKQDLIDQLLNYQVYKCIGHYFKEQGSEQLGKVYREPGYYGQNDSDRPIEIDGEMLKKAFGSVLAMARESEWISGQITEIQRELFTIEDKLSLLEEKLLTRGEAPVAFSELLTMKGERTEVIVSFQALLEYYKNGGIRFEQKGLFNEILIFQDQQKALSARIG